MKSKEAAILEKVDRIEQDLQKLKIGLVLGGIGRSEGGHIAKKKLYAK